MTSDQQQVEDWRKEFEATIDKPHLLHRFHSGTYCWDSTEWMWAGFQRAKRNQPVIELSSERWAENIGDEVFIAEEVHAAITAAGYSYKVKVQV